MTNVVRTLAIAGFVTAGLHAQIPQNGTLAFEVASIKPHPEPVFVSRGSVDGMWSRWTATTLRDLIVDAWNLKYYQIPDLPSWAESDHFDVIAKAEGALTPGDEQRRLMVQTMLAERFRLKVHFEMKEMPVYALTVGKSGSKLGPPDMDNRNGGTIAGPVSTHIFTSHGAMQALADQLSWSAGRPVLDQTGLAGLFAYDLQFSRSESATPTDSDIPSLPTALQEQVGLRLEPTRSTMKVLVIDHAEKPSEN